MTSSLVQELRVPQRKGLKHFAWHVESRHVKPLASVCRVPERKVPECKVPLQKRTQQPCNQGPSVRSLIPSLCCVFTVSQGPSLVLNN